MGTFATGPINGVRTIVFHGGYMYVASEYTNQVLQYDATTGAYVGVFVTAGSGGINGPYGMAFGPRRQPLRLRAEQQQRRRVRRHNGNLVGTFIAAGSGGLSLPEGIAFDPSGTYLYVASSGVQPGPEVQRQTGAYRGRRGQFGLSSPH